ncbi:MAG: hypothetical protein Q9220_004665 [cf. Caloplaca sp. 1 TL-2023]
MASRWVLLVSAIIAAAGWLDGLPKVIQVGASDIAQQPVSSFLTAMSMERITQLLHEYHAKCSFHGAQVEKFGEEHSTSDFGGDEIVSLIMETCDHLGKLAEGLPQYWHHVHDLAKRKLDEIELARVQVQPLASDDTFHGMEVARLVSTWHERCDFFQNPTLDLAKAFEKELGRSSVLSARFSSAFDWMDFDAAMIKQYNFDFKYQEARSKDIAEAREVLTRSLRVITEITTLRIPAMEVFLKLRHELEPRVRAVYVTDIRLRLGPQGVEDVKEYLSKLGPEVWSHWEVMGF